MEPKKKILYISYRQSLSNSIYDDLKKDGFKNYMNSNIDNEIYSAERLIC